MHIRIGYEFIFDVPAPTPMMLMLYVHPEREGDLRDPQRVQIEPDIPVKKFIDGFGNPVGRIVAPTGKLRVWYDNVIADTGRPEPAFPDARQVPVEWLPNEVLPFLRASRYCEVDLLSDIAWNLFERAPTGWERVQAICDWVHAHIEFGYPFSSPTKTAFQVYQQGQGVCRDFMHLAITMCRCMNIPARYATGYLPDIGIPISPEPMDFSAFFEVYLDGNWYPFDARNNMRRIGRVLMGRGRDAADAALTTSFGFTNLDKFTVWSDELP